MKPLGIKILCSAVISFLVSLVTFIRIRAKLVVLVEFIFLISVLNSEAKSHATSFDAMRGTRYVHPIADTTDSLSAKEITELRDDKGLPLWFSCDIYKTVCLNTQCRKVHLLIYWDGAANYLGMQLHKNEPLTKTDHKNFTQDDYEKLDRILSNPLSVLKVLKIEELTINSEDKKKNKVDAFSGATMPALSEFVVKDAVYSCYTLWHTVYGTTRDQINSILEQRTDDRYIRLLFEQKDPQYSIWAIDYIEKHPKYQQVFYHHIMNLIQSEDNNVSRKSLHFFIPDRLSDAAIQKEMAFQMEKASATHKFEIIMLFKALPKVTNDAILIMLVQFKNRKIGTGLLEYLCNLIQPENLKDSRIVEELKSISKDKNQYVKNIAQKSLAKTDHNLLTILMALIFALLLGYLVNNLFIT
ncbi:MAG: hypothetical protein M0Q53_11555 [Prolixibacteraceae bacterium]|jgi:hypothetical protein|nr:hypothetical protein [Prolixibacteraceae bacterium]